MKIIKTELVYVPKDLCNSASFWMSINDKDTKTNMITPMMIDCFSIVRLPYLNLNVMFYEVECMAFSNNCTVHKTRDVLCKNPIGRMNLVNYIRIDDFPHVWLQLSDQATTKSEEAHQYDLTSILQHDIIAIINRFDSIISGWAIMCLHCGHCICNCSNIRDRHSCIVVHSSNNALDELVSIVIDTYFSEDSYYYQNKHNKVKTK